MFRRRKAKTVFAVLVHLDGRHPYLSSDDLDFPTRDVEMTVPANDWNHAAEVAIEAAHSIQAWRYSVKSIRRAAA